jgi:hypothetical protein
MASASVMQPVAFSAAPVEAPAAAAPAAPAQAGEKESAPPAAPTSRAVKVSTPQIHWHGKSPVFAIDFHPHNRNLSAPASHCPRLPLSLLFPSPHPFLSATPCVCVRVRVQWLRRANLDGRAFCPWICSAPRGHCRCGAGWGRRRAPVDRARQREPAG